MRKIVKKQLILLLFIFLYLALNNNLEAANQNPPRPPYRQPPIDQPIDNQQKEPAEETQPSTEITQNNPYNNTFFQPNQPTQLFTNEISVQDGLINIKVIDYSVVDLLNTITNQLNKKIIINSNVQHRISVQMQNITLEDLLKHINKATGLNWTQENGIIIVANNDNLAGSTFFPIKYADLDNLKKTLATFSLNSPIITNSYPRGLIIAAPPETIKQINQMITLLDKRSPSIKVEFQVIEINRGKESTLGIAWQDGEGSYGHKKLNGDIKLMGGDGVTRMFSTGLIVSAQQSISSGKILASPYIITSHGIEAHLSTGDEIPIFSKDYAGNPAVEYKRVGIELYATPTLLEGDLLSIKAKTLVNIISGQVTQQGLTAPRISSREAETVMQIRSGQTIVIGGLIKKEELKTVTRVPILGKIPILGNLFKSTQKSKTDSEILIFITPTLVEVEEQSKEKTY